MKRFMRRQEDVYKLNPPKLSEIAKAIEDAWGNEFPDALITLKNGDIRVKYGDKFASYSCEPKLHFSDGFCYWTVSSWGTPRDKIVIGTKMPSPVSTCTIPHMGDFHGRPDDIAELEAAVEELLTIYTKIHDLLNSEVEP